MGGSLAVISPTQAVINAAELAMNDFAEAARVYLRDVPNATGADISAVAIGFSRGGATAIYFTQLLNERGLVIDGTQIVPPGVPAILVPIDPVMTGINIDIQIGNNVVGPIPVFVAGGEVRTDFAVMDLTSDDRVVQVSYDGVNHVGMGGGYDRGGSSALVLETLTGFLQK